MNQSIKTKQGESLQNQWVLRMGLVLFCLMAFVGLCRGMTVTRYQYDEAGNQMLQIDALNRTNFYAYDNMGRRIAHTMPGSQSEGFVYDLAGNLIHQTNFNGAVITNQYDVMDRLTNVASVNGYKVSYTYTATGQRATMTDPSGTTGYSYDNRDRLELKTESLDNGPSVSLNYGYDANGNVINLWSSTANGVNLAYGYDPLSRLTNVLANGSQAASYGFDLVGNLQAMAYANGVTNLYQYDTLNRLTNLTATMVSGTIDSFAYQLGLTGNRTNLSEKVGIGATTRTYAWQYDNLYRLTNENISAIGNLGYAYDPVGNRTNRQSSISQLPTASYVYNPNDWLTNTDKYDNNGSTTNSSGNSYQYDVMNHLTNFNNGAVLIDYDGDGNRVSKTVGGTTTYYVLDDRNPSGYAQVLEEWTSTGTPALSRVYNYSLDLISQRQPGVSTNYFIFDGHGSTRMLTDAGGNSVNSFAYDAFGSLIASNGTTQTAYLYCCQQWDMDLSQYYNRARTWQPNTGRFWTSDSTDGNNENPLSLCKYLYGADNPVNMVDPSGHDDGLDSMVMPVFAAVFGATINVVNSIEEHKLTILYNVKNSPSSFDANAVQNMLQSQLSANANVFYNIKGGLRFKVQVQKGAYGGDLGWSFGKTVYVNQVDFGWNNLAYNWNFAENNSRGNFAINLNKLVNASPSQQLWVNYFAHEGIWGNVAGKGYDNSISGDIASGTQDYNIQYTVSSTSRSIILKKCGLNSN